MRVVLGVLSLLVVLVIVAVVAKQQVHVVAQPPAGSGATVAGSPQAQERQMEKQVNADVQKALQAGMERNQDAERGEGGGNP